MKNKKIFLIQVFSVIVLVFSFVLALILGAEKLSVSALFDQSDRFTKIILFDLRLPRALLVFITGVVLGGSGAVFQLFFRNPLAEPGIMGISSGATLGAVIATVVSSAAVSMNISAFAGALIAGALVTALAFTNAGKQSSVMLLLCGTALGTLYSSVSSMILLCNSKELHSIYSWILGSFNGRGWKELYFILVPAVISIIIMFSIANPLDLLTGGEKTAESLGVEVNRLRIWVLIAGGLAVSAAVCAGGTIGFVGLIAPHLVRKLISPKSKKLIPYSMIFGATLLLLSDTFARVVIAPSELPAGIITGILGVPFFLSLCLKK